MPIRKGGLLRDVLAPPNLVTLLRLALLPVALWLLYEGLRGGAVTVLLVMVVTDWLDGHLARATGRITELGKILDPAADKIAIDSVLALLTARGEFPAWALAVILSRDAAIIWGAAALTRKLGKVPQSGGLGKVTFTVLAATAVVHAGDVEPLEGPLVIAAVVLAVASAVGYGARAWGARRTGYAGRHHGEC